jgi:hypothetical protein
MFLHAILLPKFVAIEELIVDLMVFSRFEEKLINLVLVVSRFDCFGYFWVDMSIFECFFQCFILVSGLLGSFLVELAKSIYFGGYFWANSSIFFQWYVVSTTI